MKNLSCYGAVTELESNGILFPSHSKQVGQIEHRLLNANHFANPNLSSRDATWAASNDRSE